ncbi:MAG: thioredoxin domain-containing protein [Solirubrobacteraceae bacterium]
MSSRKEQREQARAERLAQEQAAEAAHKRKQRLWLLGGIAALAVVIVVAIVAISSGGSDNASNGGGVDGKADIKVMLAGVPQQGQFVGDPQAKVTMIEFADLQCPFCKEFADNVTPRLIQDYVRTKKLRIQFQPLTFIGPDSEKAARYAIASGGQNKLWNFVELFYRNQGTENTGYVTTDFIHKIGAAAGVNQSQADAATGTAATTAALAKADLLAQRNGVTSTPSFLIGKTGGTLVRFSPSALEPKVFTDRIDQALAGQ